MPETDPYDLLARYYDLEHGDISVDVPLYLDFARRSGGPILELGCGTGRLLVPLAQAGYEVVGLDRSAAMLARAKARLAAAGLSNRVTLIQADITDFHLDQSFGLALSALNTFMHLTDQADQIAALTCVRRHLRPGGLLILDLPGPSEPFLIQPGLILSSQFQTAEGHRVLKLTESHYDRAQQMEEITTIYDETDAEGITRRTIVPLRLRYVFRYELELLLRLTGLRLEAIYGDYDLRPFDEEAPRLIAVSTPSPSPPTHGGR
jgi:SAM-dependent methyltransferase